MRAILIDDEPLALQLFESLLAKIKGIQLIGSFTNPHDGLVTIIEQQPDVVFLDIEMPEMNGIELAEQLENRSPRTRIVFVTAFNEYAIQAFELNAIDYLVKPVQKERLHKTINRLHEQLRYTPVPQSINKQSMVCLFQSLRFINAEGEEIMAKWRTTKVRSLFLFLLHNRGVLVRKDLLLDLFWPETDPTKGFVQLYSAVYQIRKTLTALQSDIEIANHEDGYLLDCHSTIIDVDAWENGIEGLATVNARTLSTHQQLMSMYKGDYLEEFAFVWAASEKERLRILWMQHISIVADYYKQNELYNELVLLYLRVIEIDPYTEQHYYSLMQAYHIIGDYRSIEIQFALLQDMMQKEFNQKPSSVIVEWFQSQFKQAKIGH